ncbi:helix-turn-helix domain-containing protein [Roseateles sp. BYS78W]|uniref:Helix-turn-helix domain-containing protein n=1 Tax=Pelomonas candidula TaxID=3299025 RepID=A0ABW7HBQ7_9BURK
MQPNPEGRAQEPTTAGAWLRNARQQRGLHIAALAVMLKVPQSKLEALEADRYTELPDATFARALATAVCRALKVDAAPVLALLPRTSELGFDVRPGLNQPFRERSASPIDGGVLALLKRPGVWGLGLLLIAAAAIYWVPAGWLPERDSGAPTAAFPPSPASGVVTAAASAPAVDYVPAPPAASEPAASAPAPVVLPVVAPVAAASAPTVVASAPLQVRDVAPPAGVSSGLRVTASADSWIEIADAKGQIVLSRVLRAGEQQEFNGAAPYKVRVGNVGGTKIEWRGSTVDLAARASNNVARLELN